MSLRRRTQARSQKAREARPRVGLTLPAEVRDWVIELARWLKCSRAQAIALGVGELYRDLVKGGRSFFRCSQCAGYLKTHAPKDGRMLCEKCSGLAQE